jgi:hypothetical protein
MNTLPAQEYRALMPFDQLPKHHWTFAITSDDAAPHLKLGEFAVIDRSDKDLQHGELYLIQWEAGPRDVVQAGSRMVAWEKRPASVGWWVGALDRPRNRDDVFEWWHAGKEVRMADGPYLEDHLRSKLIGRVVGYAASDLAYLLSPHGTAKGPMRAKSNRWNFGPGHGELLTVQKGRRIIWQLYSNHR